MIQMPQLTSALQWHCSFQWQSNRNYFNARGQPSAPNGLVQVGNLETWQSHSEMLSTGELLRKGLGQYCVGSRSPESHKQGLAAPP